MRSSTLLCLVLLLSVSVGGRVGAALIECTEAALEAEISTVNGACSGQTTTFNCNNTTIVLTDGRDGNRRLQCASHTIDGGDKGVAFQIGDGTCASTAEGGDWLFRLEADGITVQGLSWSGIPEGIHFGWTSSSGIDSDNSTVTNITCDLSCDDCITNGPLSTGNTLSHSTFKRGGDKCVTLDGADIGGTAYPNYDLTIGPGNTFQSCAFPLFGNEDGRFLVTGNLFQDLLDGDYDCDGPKFGANKSASNPAVYFTGNEINGCKQGVMVEGSVKFHSDGDEFISNRVRGLGCYGTSLCMVQNTTFEGNGGSSSGTTSDVPAAGFGLDGGATADLGGGAAKSTFDGRDISSGGANSFLNNRSPTDSTMDVDNNTAATLPAEGNWWGADSDPTSKVSGDVDWSPRLSSAPTDASTCGDNTADADETCDGTDLGTCTGGVSAPTCDCTSTEIPGDWTGGTLACDSSCTTWDVSSCTVAECGDSNVSGSEECDGDLIPGTCSTEDVAFIRGILECICPLIDSSGCSTIDKTGNGTRGSSTSGGSSQ